MLLALPGTGAASASPSAADSWSPSALPSPSAAASPTPAPPRLPRQPPVRAIPPQPAIAPFDAARDFEKLLLDLGKRAPDYESLAHRFICIESFRTSDDFGKEKRHDYMYVEALEQGYQPYRQQHTGRPARVGDEVRMDFGFPDSYSWTLMFVPERQHLFRFSYVRQEWFSLRLSHVIEFAAPLPFTLGRTIYEWNGQVWVDAENFNILKVEAEPGNQADRLKRELVEYRRAPRFLIYPMGKKPRGARYAITFLNEFRAISLPDQSEFRSFTLDLEGAEELDAMVTLRYSGYRFFNVNAKELLK